MCLNINVTSRILTMGGHQSKSHSQRPPKQQSQPQQKSEFSDINKTTTPPSSPAETHDNDPVVVPKTELNFAASPPTSPATELPEPDLLAGPPPTQRVSDLSAGEPSEQHYESDPSVAVKHANGTGD